MRTTSSFGTMTRSQERDRNMYPHPTHLIRIMNDDRVRNSERHRQIAAMFEGKRERGGWIARMVGFRPATRQAEAIRRAETISAQ